MALMNAESSSTGSEAREPSSRSPERGRDGAGSEPDADLNPNEGADAFETPEQAQRAKGGKKDRQDEDIITLDEPD